MSLSRRRFGTLVAALSGVSLTGGCLGRSHELEIRFEANDVAATTATGRLHTVSAAPTVALQWGEARPVSADFALFVKGPGGVLWTPVGTTTRAIDGSGNETVVSLPRFDLFDRDAQTALPSASSFDVETERGRATRTGRVLLHVALRGAEGHVLAESDAREQFDVTVLYDPSANPSSNRARTENAGVRSDAASANIEATPMDEDVSDPKPIQQLSFDDDPQFGGVFDRRPDWSYADLQPKKHLELVSGDRAHRGRSLRVALDEGNHKGCIADFQFSDTVGRSLERVHARYYVRFSEGFEVVEAGGKLPGFGGKYGCGSGGDGPCDGTDGWSARGGFDRPERHGFDTDEGKVQLAYYLYHADMEDRHGNKDPWVLNNNAGAVERERWYRLDCYVEMNTPGKNDGVLRGWVDGTVAYDRTDLKFRAEGYGDIKVKSWLHEVYYGGGWPSPRDQAVFIDGVEIYDQPLLDSEKTA